MIDKVQTGIRINIDTSKNSNSASIIEFDVELRFIAITYSLVYVLRHTKWDTFKLDSMRGRLACS